MNALIDLHTHSLSSGHAYSTIQENVAAAAAKGLKYYGISDHAPAMAGGPHHFHFINMRAVPEMIGAVRVLKGIELNVLTEAGDMDYLPRYEEILDYGIASLHVQLCQTKSREEHTQAILNAITHPFVKVLGHPDDSRFPIDAQVVVKACKQQGVLIEINNSSLGPNTARQGAEANVRELLKWVKEYQAEIIMGSDAHYSADVGNFENSWRLIVECEVDPRLVVNFHDDLIHRFLTL